MPRTKVAGRQTIALAGGFATSAAALGLLGVASPEALLERSFERAMRDTAPRSLAAGPASVAPGSSEEQWLRQPSPDRRIVPAKAAPLSPGDKITMTSSGHERALEVVDVRELTAPASDSGSVGHLYLVTCRDPQSTTTALVRMVWDTRIGWPAVLAENGRATL